jgi:hypothetical protein
LQLSVQSESEYLINLQLPLLKVMPLLGDFFR